MKNNVVQFSTHIRTLRQAQNLSIKELAKKSGVSQFYLEQLEQDRIPPRMTVYHAVRLARALGCKLHELFE